VNFNAIWYGIGQNQPLYQKIYPAPLLMLLFSWPKAMEWGKTSLIAGAIPTAPKVLSQFIPF